MPVSLVKTLARWVGFLAASHGILSAQAVTVPRSQDVLVNSRQQTHFVVQGVLGSGATPSRREINDLVQDEVQFSLFIQALAAMQAEDQQSELSYFQVAGIHGLPFVQWSGSGPSSFASSDSWGGYCTHRNVLFPSWHRPYGVVFEQLLNQKAVDIANTYTVDQGKYQSAAENLRSPYWDWAQNIIPPPEVIELTEVTITMPNGSRQAVANPLFTYHFHPIDPGFADTPYTRWNSTLRYPTSDGPDAKTDVGRMKSQLASSQRNVRTSTYAMLTRAKTWADFSNTGLGGDRASTANSLEAIHDGIHNDCGGGTPDGRIGGHMSDPAIAAFDPIFWLHHTNVDRMLSLWSAVNPGLWVTEGSSALGTYSIEKNITVGATTDLSPFWDTTSSYWQSTMVESTEALGYTYPEFDGLNMGDTAAVRSSIAKQIKSLYGGGASFNSKRELTTRADGSLDWSARVQVDKFALGGKTFDVLIFLGDVPSDPAQWYSASSFVGRVTAFASSLQNTGSPELIEGFVDLNSFIAEHSGLSSFGSDEVKAYIDKNLALRVQTSGSQAVDVNEVPSLAVTVVSTPETNNVASPSSKRELSIRAGNEYLDWTVRVQVDKFALGGHTFNVLIFLGDVPSDAKEWRSAASFVGSVTAFATPLLNHGRPALIEGFVHLNNFIAEHSGLHSFDPEEVKPYLKENLAFRIQTAGSQPVDPDEVPSLDITVASTPVTDVVDSLPEYRDAQYQADLVLADTSR
ncbi:Di-copper centre-containing protein [Peniophora sp. CONT]|nr:Di-copper centre-containing protein [Peniophora sp. CONT]